MKQKLLAAFMVLALIIAVSGCAPSDPAQENGNADNRQQPVETIVWRVQGFTPPGTLFYTWLEDLAELVEELSGGRLIFDTYPPGAIVPPFEALSAVRDGVLDANHGYPGMWIGHNIAAPLFNSVPGGFLAQDQAMWLYEGGGMELYQEMMDPFNAKILVAGLIGMEIFMWSETPMHTIDDMRGKQLRMMPLMGEILGDNDLSVVFLPGGEIIPSLERGVLDAAEYSIPAFDITLGFQDVANYYHYPGIHQPASFLELAINQGKWNELPDDLKSILEHACRLSVFDIWIESEAENIRVLEQFEEMGLEQIVMEEESVTTMMNWSNEWMDEKSAEDPFFAKVRESQVEFSKWWYPYKEATSLPIPAWALD